MSLTDVNISNAKRGAKPHKLFDARGMFLLIAPNGGKRWRFRYRFAGKDKLLSLGVYPDVSLEQARIKRDEMRKQADGLDSSEVRKVERQADREAMERQTDATRF